MIVYDKCFTPIKKRGGGSDKVSAILKVGGGGTKCFHPLKGGGGGRKDKIFSGCTYFRGYLTDANGEEISTAQKCLHSQ